MDRGSSLRFESRPAGQCNWQSRRSQFHGYAVGQVRRSTVLSHHQERQLELIGAHTYVEDPRFAEALTAGRPRRPRQYRAGMPLLELLGVVLVIIGSALMGVGAAFIAGSASVVVVGALWARRRLRLDRPPTRPR
jgi:hypothetical protein